MNPALSVLTLAAVAALAAGCGAASAEDSLRTELVRRALAELDRERFEAVLRTAAEPRARLGKAADGDRGTLRAEGPWRAGVPSRRPAQRPFSPPPALPSNSANQLSTRFSVGRVAFASGASRTATKPRPPGSTS
jgi:hypothetical protein